MRLSYQKQVRGHDRSYVVMHDICCAKFTEDKYCRGGGVSNMSPTHERMIRGLADMSARGIISSIWISPAPLVFRIDPTGEGYFEWNRGGVEQSCVGFTNEMSSVE